MFRKLFGLKEKIRLPTVQEVVQSYSGYIEKCGMGLEVRDERDLPHSKNAILNAMLIAQTRPQLSESTQEIMMSMTLMLAQFQPNVGKPLHALGLDPTNLDINAPNLAAQIASGGASKARYDSFQPTVGAEILQIRELIKKTKAVARKPS